MAFSILFAIYNLHLVTSRSIVLSISEAKFTMSNKADNTKSNSGKKTHKKRVSLVVLTFLLLGGVVIAFFVYYSGGISTIIEKSKNSSKIEEPYKPGKGGDPSLVTSYHDQAVEAQKSGDDEKAKKLAEKGLSANTQLTIAQQEQVPNQANTIIELTNIKYGKKLDD